MVMRSLVGSDLLSDKSLEEMPGIVVYLRSSSAGCNGTVQLTTQAYMLWLRPSGWSSCFLLVPVMKTCSEDVLLMVCECVFVNCSKVTEGIYFSHWYTALPPWSSR